MFSWSEFYGVSKNSIKYSLGFSSFDTILLHFGLISEIRLTDFSYSTRGSTIVISFLVSVAKATR